MSGEDAMYKMTVDLPTLPKGEPVQIVGLGTFENKGTYTVTKDQAEYFRSHHSRQIEVRDDTGDVVGSELELGPTLLQSSKNMYGVEVESAGADTKAQNTQRSVVAGDDTSKNTPNAALSEAQTPTGDKPATSNQPKPAQGGDN
jgi:hypothetical protein